MSTMTDVERIERALEEIRQVVADGLVDPAVGSGRLVEMARAVDGVERTGHGLLLRVLARVDAAKAVPAGVGTWLTAELGYQPGRGRALAQDARRIGALPALTEQLSSGRLGRDTTRVLARVHRAVAGTTRDPEQAVAEALDVVERDGIQEAEKRVRALEHTVDPGRAEDLRARQRARSFARVSELSEGMCRFDVLLDAERATMVRTALDVQVSSFLRARQFDGTEEVPGDVINTEQLTAEAFTRLAEVFLNSTESQRTERYTPTVVYYAPAAAPAPGPKSEPAPTPLQEFTSAPHLVETAYGALIPAPTSSQDREPAAIHLTVDPTGQPIAIDGHLLDLDPHARLASPAQRLALAYRDRHCTHPGCTRPATWSLHSHHAVPHSHGGPTTLANMVLLCPQHHTLTHHEALR